MRITFEVPDNRAAFVLELLRSLPFTKICGQAAKVKLEAKQDITDYLLASPANAERLRLAYEQFNRGERVDFTL